MQDTTNAPTLTLTEELIELSRRMNGIVRELADRNVRVDFVVERESNGRQTFNVVTGIETWSRVNRFTVQA